MSTFLPPLQPFITSRLDYCNSPLYVVPDHHMQKLQCVMNASARLLFCAPKHCHITPLLQQLHELPICLRIKFKILLITLKLLQGTASKYLIDLISVLPPSRYDLWRNNKGILLSTPKHFTKVTMGDQSFMAVAPWLWNHLPISIRFYKSGRISSEKCNCCAYQKRRNVTKVGRPTEKQTFCCP